MTTINQDTMGKEQRIDLVLSHLREASLSELEIWLETEDTVDVAQVLESLPPEQRRQVWLMLTPIQQSGVMQEVGELVLASLADGMSAENFVSMTQHMETDDLVEVLENLPDELSESFKEELSQDVREQVDRQFSYNEGTAGRLMNPDVVSVRSDVTLEVVLRYLQKLGALPDNTDGLMVIDREGHYQGKLALQKLLTNHEDTLVEALMHMQGVSVPADMAEQELAALFEEQDLLSVAVVDEQNILLGRVTIDDVVDIIREHGEHQMMGMAGLDEEEDLFAPVIPSARRRGVWLGINLLTAFLASWVIGQFQGALDQLVALAVLMPIVASMGGIAGSQTLTLVIRGQALGQIGKSNFRWLLKKEVLIGFINGCLWAVVVALLAWVWFESVGIAIVIGVAIVINLIAAAASGIVIPSVLKRFGIDPALSGSVILTTVTDVVGFMSFLGLASLFLLS